MASACTKSQLVLFVSLLYRNLNSCPFVLADRRTSSLSRPNNEHKWTLRLQENPSNDFIYGCPPAYDPSKTYVAGDVIEVENNLFRCKPYPYESYCSQAEFDPAMSEENKNAEDLWLNAWSTIGKCSATVTSFSTETAVGKNETNEPQMSSNQLEIEGGFNSSSWSQKNVTAAPTVHSQQSIPTSRPTTSSLDDLALDAPKHMPSQRPTDKSFMRPSIQSSNNPTNMGLTNDTTILSHKSNSPTESTTTSKNSPSLIPTVTHRASPVTAPTASLMTSCGNSICELSETYINCPVDCQNLELVTTSSGNRGVVGTLFYVNALRDIIVTSIGLYGSEKSVDLVQVYTRPGKYEGYELYSDGWNLVYDNPSVNQLGRDEITELGVFNAGVSISAGSFQSFLVYTPNKLVCDLGTSDLSEGLLFKGDHSLLFYEGMGIGDLFSGNSTIVYSPRIFKGLIR